MAKSDFAVCLVVLATLQCTATKEPPGATTASPPDLTVQLINARDFASISHDSAEKILHASALWANATWDQRTETITSVGPDSAVLQISYDGETPVELAIMPLPHSSGLPLEPSYLGSIGVKTPPQPTEVWASGIRWKESITGLPQAELSLIKTGIIPIVRFVNEAAYKRWVNKPEPPQ